MPFRLLTSHTWLVETVSQAGDADGSNKAGVMYIVKVHVEFEVFARHPNRRINQEAKFSTWKL